MFLCLQILGIGILLATIILFFGKYKKRSASVIAWLCILLIFTACMSNILLKKIPMPTEQVTITATGEKNNAALSNEVALLGIISDGKRFEIQAPSSGNWFWYEPENDYMWRDESDSRLTETLTREIVLDVPVGAGRQLVFFNNAYRGIVAITYEGETTLHDLYSEERTEAGISIPSSDEWYDNMVKLGRLALYVLFILLLMIAPVIWGVKSSKSPDPQNLTSGYFIVVIVSVCGFLGFLIHNLVSKKLGGGQAFANGNSVMYIAALCIFAVVFFMMCVVVQLIPKRFTEKISKKRLPPVVQICTIVGLVLGSVAIWTYYLFITSVSGSVTARDLVTVFLWRKLPVALIAVYTVSILVYVFWHIWTRRDVSRASVNWVYFVAILLTFVHCLYVYIGDKYHACAYFDSIYNCYHGVPYNIITTGIYGHYGIFLGLLLRLIHGNAITLFYFNALLGAAMVAACAYILEKVVQKHLIRIIAILSCLLSTCVIGTMVHWQRVPHRILFPILLVAYVVHMCSDKKFGRIDIVLGYLLTAIALVWNTEGGLACIASFTAAMIAHFWQEHKWFEKQMVRTYVELAIFAGLSIIGALAFVNVYNLLCGGTVIIKDFFFPLTESRYMNSWDTIDMPVGNQAWIYILAFLAVTLLYGLYHTRLINTERAMGAFHPYAPMAVCLSVVALLVFIYYASRAVYICLDISCFHLCIAMAFWADHFTFDLSDIKKKPLPIIKIACKAAAVSCVIILSCLASQIIFTVPNLLDKADSRIWDAGKLHAASEQLEMVVPKDAQLIGAGVSILKLDLGWDSPYYYRNTGDIHVSGSLIEDQMIEDSLQCDYVAFYIGCGADRRIMSKFISVCPEYREVSRNYIDGIETVLFSSADSASGYTLATSLQYNGTHTVDGATVELSEGTEAYSPSVNLQAGKYSVLIHGDNFENVAYEAVFNERDVLDLVETTRENGQIIYTFELRETMQVKFKLQNKSQIPVKLSGIEILVDAS